MGGGTGLVMALLQAAAYGVVVEVRRLVTMGVNVDHGMRME